MKLLFAFLLATLALQQPAQADTTDSWKVYYNKILLRQFTASENGGITLKAAIIRPTDSLAIVHHTDAPCVNCTATVTVVNDSAQVVITVTGTAIDQPIKIPLHTLLQYQQPGKESEYAVYYYKTRAGEKGEPLSVRIFRIWIE